MVMDDVRLIEVLTLFDSQLPTGAFVFSWGIEAYVESGFKEENVKELILSFIDEGPLLLDLFVCRLSYISSSNGEDIGPINDFYSACKYLPSAHEASITLGSNLIRAGRTIFNLDLSNIGNKIHFPIAVGIIGNKLNIPIGTLLLAFAHSSVKSILNAIIRCMPMSSFKLWSLLVNLKDEMEKCVKIALELENINHLHVNTFLWDVNIHRQHFLETRLFEG